MQDYKEGSSAMQICPRIRAYTAISRGIRYIDLAFRDTESNRYNGVPCVIKGQSRIKWTGLVPR